MKRKQASVKQSNPPPPYGSKQYWERRYCVSYSSPAPITSDASSSLTPDTDMQGLKGHIWYFEYKELQPLILPLLLGREDDDIRIQDVQEGNEDTQTHQMTNNPDHPVQTDNTHSNPAPKRVLEIGCGDVPLGPSICTELRKIQYVTNVNALQIVDRIICIDYAKPVIDILQTRQDNVPYTPCHDDGDKNTNNDKEAVLQVEYAHADARKLPYRNQEFHLILEKGTLDAVLSDPENGLQHCQKIVSEAARVLAWDGYIFIATHINTSTPTGQSWIQEVLVAGLQYISCDDEDEEYTTSWTIESHGSEPKPMNSDSNSSTDMSDDMKLQKQDECSSTTTTRDCPEGDDQIDEDQMIQDTDFPNDIENDIGPSVYIIQKKKLLKSILTDKTCSELNVNGEEKKWLPSNIELNCFYY